MSGQRDTLLLLLNSTLWGGGENYALRMVQFAQRVGWHVRVVVPDGPLPERFAAAGCALETVNWGWQYAKTRGLGALTEFRTGQMRRDTSRLLAGNEARTVVFMQYVRERLALTEFLRTRDVPVLWTEHGVLPRWLTGNPVIPSRYAAAAHHASRIIAISRATQASMVRLGVPTGRIDVIYNGVTVPETLPAQRADYPGMEPDTGRVRIGMVSSLSREKGVPDLLAAAARPELAAAAVYLAGRGMGIGTGWRQGNARGLGFICAVDHLYDTLDIAVSPSRGRGEGIPLRVQEAMAHGLPVVATDVGGIREIMTDGEDGLIVPPRNPAALARALARLVTDEALRRRLGAAARTRARRDFTLARMERETMAILESLR